MKLSKIDDLRRVPNHQRPAIRKMVVKAIRKGACPIHISATFGIGLRTIITWIKKFLSGGWKALENRPKKGRPRILNEMHLNWLLRAVRDSNPMQLKFEFAYWTLKLIRQALIDKFGLTLSVSTVRRALRALGMSPQKPKVKAYQRDDKAFEKWKSEDFPKIKKKAEKEGATILFEDEAGIAASYHVGTTWGMRGKTPQVELNGARYRISMLGAIGADGRLHYELHEGTSTSETFIGFLQAILDETGSKIFIITDNLSIHNSNKVKEYIASQGEMIEIFYLPTYSPQLTPIEQVWSLVKRAVGKKLTRSKAELKEHMEAELEELKGTPEKVRNMFKEPDCCYILA